MKRNIPSAHGVAYHQEQDQDNLIDRVPGPHGQYSTGAVQRQRHGVKGGQPIVTVPHQRRAKGAARYPQN